jgi:hypothetical protein
MNKIKVGDYVKCIDDDTFSKSSNYVNFKLSDLTKNEVYKVLHMTDEFYFFSDDMSKGWLKERFVKAYSLKDKLALIKELIK